MPDLTSDDAVYDLWKQLRRETPVVHGVHEKNRLCRKGSPRLRKKVLTPWLTIRWRKEN